MGNTRGHTPDLPVDSAVYLSTADNIRDTGTPTAAFNLPWDGFAPSRAIAFHGRVPSTHFPPGYPAALAATSFVAGSTRGAARLLDVALVAVNVFLVGWMTARMTAYRSVVVATIPGLLLVFAADVRPTFFDAFGWLTLQRSVASEPLFTALFMVGLLALSSVLTSSPTRTRRALVVVAGVGMAAPLVRYIGFAFVLTAVVALVALDHRHALRVRLRRTAVVAGAAVVPTLAVLGWAAAKGGASPRPIFFHPVAESARRPLLMFGHYLYARDASDLILLPIVGLVIVGVVVGVAWRRALFDEGSDDERAARVLIQLCLLGATTYVLFVIVTRTFFDVNTPIDARLFAPIRGLWYMVVVAVAYWALNRVASRVVAVAIISAFALTIFAGGWSQQRRVLNWKPVRPAPFTEFDDAISRLPRGAVIVSNRPDAVWTETGRSSIALPTAVEYASGAPNGSYGREMAQLVRDLQSRGGYLALSSLFARVSTPPELRRALDLHLITTGPSDFALLYEVVPGTAGQ